MTASLGLRFNGFSQLCGTGFRLTPFATVPSITLLGENGSGDGAGGVLSSSFSATPCILESGRERFLTFLGRVFAVDGAGEGTLETSSDVLAEAYSEGASIAEYVDLLSITKSSPSPKPSPSRDDCRWYIARFGICSEALLNRSTGKSDPRLDPVLTIALALPCRG